MPHVIRTTRVSDVPRFYCPAAKDRRAARNPGDPGFRAAAFLRPGIEVSNFRMQSGRPGFRIRPVFTVRRRRIGVPHAIWATRVPDLLGFYNSATKNRRAARHAIRATQAYTI